MENIMSLPKIEHPIFKIKIPSSKREVRFRPFLVKEEKILLIAKTSEQENDILLAIKQVVNNCALDDLNIDKLALFDVEYLFLRIRAQSVNNIVSVTYRDNEDSTDYDFDIDLNNVNVVFPLNLEKTIKLTETSGIVMKYPTLKLINGIQNLKDENIDTVLDVVVSCIDYVYDADQMYYAKDTTKEELIEFVESMEQDDLEKIQIFFSTMPRITKTLDFKCKKCEYEEQVVVEGVQNFFV
jgi:hypothetical protein